MKNKDAKALGRWCEKHKQQYTRVQFPSGACATGCPDCLSDPEFVSIINEFTAGFQKLVAEGHSLEAENER